MGAGSEDGGEVTCSNEEGAESTGPGDHLDQVRREGGLHTGAGTFKLL